MTTPLTWTGRPAAAAPGAGRRTPGEWPVFSVGPSAPGVLTIADDVPTPTAPMLLRLTVALEVWQEARLELRAGGEPLGTVVLDHSDCFEAIDVPLTAREAALAQAAGVEVSTGASDPLWFFGAGAPPALAPGMRSPGSAHDRTGAMLDRMRDLGSLQQFGWKEGCVLDGMLALHRARPDDGFAEAIDTHLSVFRTAEGGLRYEDPWGRGVEGSFLHGIEAALPFAVLAERDPRDPLLESFVEFALTSQRADGLVIDDDMVSAEGCYTIAYPLAAIARRCRRPELVPLALAQLELRRTRLADGDVVWLRDEPSGRTFRSWTRAWSWYLLGLVRTLEQIDPADRPAALAAEFTRAAAAAMARQLPDGCWRVFLDEPETGTDTSGSAGIAAALAVGHRLGIAPHGALAAARRTHESLLGRLTDDGLLTGATQANKDGERLQRCDYRVTSQMGTGLLAQLHAELLGAR